MSWAAVLFTLGTIGHLVPPEGPAISALSPSTGSPRGGQTITVTGRNFQPPVRVLFELGDGSSLEASLISATPTQVSLLTPPVTIAPPAQAIEATIVVVTNAGTGREMRATSGTPFSFRHETLTPRLFVLTPNTGAMTGGSRVAIFGEGFQQPVRVLFGSSEAQVILASFSEVMVVVPPMLDEVVVDVQVDNVGSQTMGRLPAAFRYRPKSQITRVSPTSGNETQPTRVTIDGVGFYAPVSVKIGGAAAQPIFVSGTRVIALTMPAGRTCTDTKGPVTVTNIMDGDQADSPLEFTYVGTQPEIVSVHPARAIAGGRVEVTLSSDDATGAEFTIAGFSVTPLSTRTEGAMTTVVLPVPKTLAFQELMCDDGKTRARPVRTTIVYTKRDTTCHATTPLIIGPDSSAKCTPATVQP